MNTAEPDDSVQNDGPSERLYDIISITAGVGTFAVFGFAGLTALDSLVYGLLAGAMTGIGSSLFLPWFLRVSTVQENATEQISLAEAIERVSSDPQLRILGLGLDLGGVVMFAMGFVFDKPNLLYGAGAGIAVALVVFLAGTLTLGRL